MRHHARNAALAGPTLALLTAIATTSLSRAYPGDVFVAGSPAKGPAAQKPVEVPTGTWNVSPQTGAAIYSFPIAVPPGRNGMAPNLSLEYSSQNPMRGGIAAGWELRVPSIEVDTSTGILAGMFYRSSMAGGQRLVRVVEPLPSGPVPCRLASSWQGRSYTRRSTGTLAGKTSTAVSIRLTTRSAPLTTS